MTLKSSVYGGGIKTFGLLNKSPLIDGGSGGGGGGGLGPPSKKSSIEGKEGGSPKSILLLLLLLLLLILLLLLLQILSLASRPLSLSFFYFEFFSWMAR